MPFSAEAPAAQKDYLHPSIGFLIFPQQVVVTNMAPFVLGNDGVPMVLHEYAYQIILFILVSIQGY